MMRRVVAALVLAACSFAVGHATVGQRGRSWPLRTEDDAPACWRTSAGVVCGPLSWAPVGADIVK